MKKLFISISFLSLVLLMCLALSSCSEGGCPHEFENACDSDCAICDYTRTVTHVYNEADCYNPAVCRNCDHVDGEPLGHNVVFQRGIEDEAKLCDQCHFFVYPDNHTEPYHD